MIETGIAPGIHLTSLVMLWHAYTDESIRLKHWGEDDGVAVFDLRSGSTHLIDPFQAEIIGVLQTTPVTLQALFEVFSQRFSDEDKAHALEYIETSLSRLRYLNLVKTTPS